MNLSKVIEEIYFKYNVKSFVNCFIILILAFCLIQFVMYLTTKIIQITKFNEQRERTLKSIFDSIFSYFILTLAILNILSEFGLVKQSTILTSAGIITLVAGLGAQNLIKDIINGFFILFERQMKVGDIVSINEQYMGTVEEIGLRSTAIREFSSRKIYIPNGEIKTIKNYYKNQARVILNIIVPFEENHEQVLKILKEACEYVNITYDDKLYKIGNINYSEFSVYGIVALDGRLGGAKYVITGTVKPHEQWFLRNRTYEYILKTFCENDLRIAYPKIHLENNQ
ncbi:mechanosensitive ion channel family protein [Lutibacter sp. B2]|nr:mechanosensitive ion channel family protein [Lutibacter sp. B2]